VGGNRPQTVGVALAVFGAIPVAQAATGGASGYEAAAPSSGEEVAFGPVRYAGASWYGPGLWGRSTACGVTLRPTTIGVAHKSLPCGTVVRFVYEGRTVTAPVIDRGPYVKGRAWDLTAAASEALGLEAAGVARIGYQVALEYARR
jgi:peptidoglycan lytic transglycosylase